MKCSQRQAVKQIINQLQCLQHSIAQPTDAQPRNGAQPGVQSRHPANITHFQSKQDIRRACMLFQNVFIQSPTMATVV